MPKQLTLLFSVVLSLILIKLKNDSGQNTTIMWDLFHFKILLKTAVVNKKTLQRRFFIS